MNVAFRSTALLFLGIAWLALPHGAVAAPPDLTSLYPAGAARGQTVPVTAGGKFDHWPVEVWVDHPGLTVKPDKDKGKFAVTVAPDALPGVYWLRLHDQAGASLLRPFVVGLLPEVLEQEPNDHPLKPQVLPATAVVVNGRHEKGNDADVYALPLRKGQTLVASIVAHETLGSPMDATLQILDAKGFVLNQNNDDHDIDPRLVFEAPYDGTFLVRCFAFDWPQTSDISLSGGPKHIYRLTITTGGFINYPLPLAVPRSETGKVELVGWNIPELARAVSVTPPATGDKGIAFHPDVANPAEVLLVPHAIAVEKEPNNSAQESQEVPLPVTVSGVIGTAGDVDVYRFRATKGLSLQFKLESNELGYLLDGLLRVTTKEGKLLRELDDASQTRDVTLNYQFPADGEYCIEVSDLNRNGGPRFAYRLSMTPPTVDYELTAGADRFTVKSGEKLEIPLTVNRIGGFAGEIEISLANAPAGMTVTPLKSLVKDSKTVKLELKAGPAAFSGPLQIVAKSKVGEQSYEHLATAAIESPAAKTVHLWLTIVAPAEPAKK